MIGLIGKKVGMTHLFKEDGGFIPVTVIQAGPCKVVQKKSDENNGYCSLQLGFNEVPEKKIKKPQLGQFKKLNISPQQILREFKVDSEEIKTFTPGQELTTSLFKKGDYVDITGLSRGKGFAGVMKRHGFKGAPASHGTAYGKRHGGSIGCRFPQHTRKGMRMAGRMGQARVTIQNLEVTDIKPEDNLILVRGAIPGGKNNFVLIKKAKKKS